MRADDLSVPPGSFRPSTSYLRASPIERCGVDSRLHDDFAFDRGTAEMLGKVRVTGKPPRRFAIVRRGDPPEFPAITAAAMTANSGLERNLSLPLRLSIGRFPIRLNPGSNKQCLL